MARQPDLPHVIEPPLAVAVDSRCQCIASSFAPGIGWRCEQLVYRTQLGDALGRVGLGLFNQAIDIQLFVFETFLQDIGAM